MDRWSREEIVVVGAAVLLLVVLPLFIYEAGLWWSLALFLAGMYLHVKRKLEKEERDNRRKR